MKDFEKKKIDFESLLEVFLKVLIKFNESYYNEIGDYEYKLIKFFTSYNNPEYFKEAFKVNCFELQNKIYADYAFLYIDINKFGVACDSTSQTCPLMWGHYGNNHAGICSKFEFYDDKENQNICLSKDEKLEVVTVDYSDSALNIFNYNELENLILTIYKMKCSKWAYENEVRLINNSQGSLKINKKSIRQIIFGCKTTPKDRYSILKLIGCLGYTTDELMIAKIQPDFYEVKIDRMTMEDMARSGVYLEELNFKKTF